MPYLEKAKAFMEIADQFRLGELPTEKPNPDTEGLSEFAKKDLNKAFSILKSVDLKVLDVMATKLDDIDTLSQEVKATLAAGHNIYLCGCGATGRLSLALETLWRERHRGDELEERVIGFMAGGDVALIQSIENFEDYPEYGARQLKELGFKDGDLFIGITEGGETPFVIGATEYASLVSSKRHPYFLYCNPDEILCQQVKRSKRVIENPRIKKMELSVGPMALTGSTRMQATTIQMYAVGLALWFYPIGREVIEAELLSLRASLEQVPDNLLAPFTELEAEIYSKNNFIYYETDEKLGISILTDTTERSPTFSLFPFESQEDEKKLASLSYLYFPKAADGKDAWESLLGRVPRTLEWNEEVSLRAGFERLKGFDFSLALVDKREEYLDGRSYFFKIYQKEGAIEFELADLKASLPVEGLTNLSVHILLKILLNSHSTLVMGKMGRYESNIMTWVRSSNNKLIDRSARYIQLLLQQKGIHLEYEKVIENCFKLMADIGKDKPLVLEVIKYCEENQDKV
jgi:N-acetylmuramic acid 6-phosphate etherase